MLTNFAKKKKKKKKSDYSLPKARKLKARGYPGD